MTLQSRQNEKVILSSGKEKNRIKDYLEVLRIDHWFKNIFTLIGAIGYLAYSKEHPTAIRLLTIFVGCGLSCLVSSINYIINEILDASYDIWHPRKKFRPIPSGRVTQHNLYIIMILLFAASFSIAFKYFSLRFTIILFLFFISGLIYNVKPVRAKEIPYIDVIVESVNNPIRIALGWYALADPVTVLPFTSIMFFWVYGAFLMTGKRLAEMRFLGDRALPYRKTFQYYTERSLLTAMAIYAAASVLFYIYLIFRVFQFNNAYLCGLGLLIIFYIWCFRLVLEDDSILKEPETLLKKPGFFIFCLLGMGIVLATFLLR